MSNNPSQPLTAAGTPKLLPTAPIAGFFADPANNFAIATNIDVMGDAGLALLMKCTGQPTVPSDTLDGVPFPVKFYYAHMVELANQRTGEIESRVRLVLVSPEGETCSFVSQGVIDSLDLIRRFKGDGPYNPPLKVKVTRQKTRSQNIVLRLEFVPNEHAEAATVDHGGQGRKR